MEYGAQVWCKDPEGGLPAAALTKSLRVIQNQGLRRIAGAYKSTPIPCLENETGIPPLDLQLEKLRLGRIAPECEAKATILLEQRRSFLWRALHRRSRRPPPLPPNSLTHPKDTRLSGDISEPIKLRLFTYWKRQWEDYARSRTTQPIELSFDHLVSCTGN